MRLLLLFIIPGVLALYLGLAQFFTHLDSQNWDSVPGEVYSSSVKENPSSVIVTYSPQIEYRCTLNGQAYTGFKITLNDFRSTDRAEVEELVAKYPPKTPVMVYYRESKPFDPILERRVTRGMIFVLGLAAILMVVSGVAAAIYLKAVRVMRNHAETLLRLAPKGDMHSPAFARYMEEK
jgi:hypothetical protein